MRKLLLAAVMGLVSVYAAAFQNRILDKEVKVDFTGETVTQILQELAEEYDFGLSYRAGDVENDHAITISFEGKLYGLFEELFAGTDIEVIESNRQIILKKKPEVRELESPGTSRSSVHIYSPPIVIPAIDTTRVAADTIPTSVQEVYADTLDFGGHSHDPLEYKGYRLRPAHVGLIYPISSNGIDAKDFVNNVSFHLLAGVSAGVHGVTFAAIANNDIHFVEGVQFAGISNLTAGYVQGIQFAGITNIAGKQLTGLQFAGIANIAGDTARAGQFAGIANVNASEVYGAQFAGIANVNSKSVQGAQVAGIANVTPGHHKGAQIAGLSNVAGSLDGAQIAGFTNVSSGRTNGFQLAGFANVGGTVHGSQLALFNFADSVSGVSIGFLSIIKHGYRRVEISGSEALHVQMAFKIGTQRFYNIFSFGYHFSEADAFEYGEEPTWAYGYGIGSEFNLSHTWKLNLDLTTFDVIEKENTFTDKKLNLLNQFRLNFGAQLGRKFTIAFGPSFNVMVSELHSFDSGTGSDLPPYTVYDETHGDINYKMWPGFNVAIRF